MGRDLIAPDPRLLIEFVGLPGSGKSTISHEFADALRDSGREVREPVWTNYRLLSERDRRSRKIRIALRESILHRLQAFRGLRSILGTDQSRPADYPSMLLNWFYIAGLCREAARHSGVTVFDQGILQALWSVAYGSSAATRMSIDEWSCLAGDCLPPGSVAVIVEADAATLKARLARRGGGRGRLDSALARSDEEFDRALEKGNVALAFVDRVALSLVKAGRLRIERLDSGSGDPEFLARRLVELLSERDLG